MAGISSQFVADVPATRRGYSKLITPDADCCSACATFNAAVDKSLFPPEFVEMLSDSGADVRKPIEVWGEPEEGFLQGFYVVAGHLTSAPWSGQGEGAFREPRPGFKYYVTEHVMMNDPAFHGQPIVQIEFMWEGEEVQRIRG